MKLSLQAKGCTVLRRYPLGNVALVGLPEGMTVPHGVELLGTVSTVRKPEPNRVKYLLATPNDPRYPEQYHWPLIDAPLAWDVTTGSPSTVVAIIDTGIDYTHEDLAAKIWTNPGEIPGNVIDDDHNGFVDDVRGWDFAYGDNNPMDVFGCTHRRHVEQNVGQPRCPTPRHLAV